MSLWISSVVADPAVQAPPVPKLDSIYDLVMAGGPVMIPLALCSIIAFAYAVERAVRLRRSALGLAGFDAELLAAVGAGGVQRGLELCTQRATPIARVMQIALSRWGAPFVEREKVVEEAGLREVRALSANLKPLVIVSMIAPLLGFLGTVFGMIIAFTTVALHGGLGKPEMLASGIAQALVTTAAGLAIAIPAQAAYYWLRARIDRFARKTEDLYAAVQQRVAAAGVPDAHS